EAFNPATNTMVGFTAAGVRIAKLGGPVRTVPQPPQGHRPEVPELFFHRGRLIAAHDRVYELIGSEWKAFGDGFRILAMSSNDRYWLVGADDQSIWKVTFP
ncbi:MAG: hypothetical protein ABIV13_01165, partial [Fimbriimonadales bacterium]